MRKRLLFIDEKESFISRAIMDNLKKYDYEVEFCETEVRALSKLSDVPSIIFLNVEENFVTKHMEFLVYLKDICVEDDKIVFITGYNNDMQEVTDILPKEIVGGTFERPVNTKVVAEAIENKLEIVGDKLGRKHILVVDDSGEYLRAIKGWLSNKYNVSMVNSATNAIAFLASNRPDLILLDYEMPICSGPQLLEMIRAEGKTADIPVMFLTSKDDAESVKKVLALHPQGYLLKNLPPEKINESINEFFQLNKKA